MADKIYDVYHQEIELTSEQEACLKYTGNRTLMVKGYAGAGKSLVLMALAQKYLEKFSGKDQMVAPAAIGALANCYANAGQNSKAAATFEKAAKKADNNSLSPTFLIQAGELYEAQGKPEKALECYNEIKTKYVNSMAYQEIDKYIERVSK